MKCKECKHELVEGAKFCSKCGTEVKKACPNPNCTCEFIPEEARFCPECGTDLTNLLIEREKKKKQEQEKIKEAGKKKRRKVLFFMAGGFAALCLVLVLIIFSKDEPINQASTKSKSEILPDTVNADQERLSDSVRKAVAIREQIDSKKPDIIKEKSSINIAKKDTSTLKVNESNSAIPNFEMITITGGTFEMGSNQGENNEKPIHKVRISTFKMGKTEVTQAQWKAIMGNNPSEFKGNNLPVENVSWEDVQGFIEKLNHRTGLNYRLPTEAEWEFAAGGGVSDRTLYAGTSVKDSLDLYAWYDSNSSSKTHPVATKRPNSLGLYDMNGNVWEWCQDRYDGYSSDFHIDPTGPSSGSRRVDRGGSWGFSAQYCRVAYRSSDSPDFRCRGLGFRLVLVP